MKPASARPDAPAIAAQLRDIAAGLKLAGESKFRVQAYERGADALDAFTGDLDRAITEERLTEMPGVGDRLAAVVAQLRATGTSPVLESVTDGLPPGALALARGPKLSLRAIRTLSEADVRTLDALREAAREGRLRGLRGFSEKTEARILREMTEAEGREGKVRLSEAREVARAIARFLGDGARRSVEIVGEARRGLEVVQTVDLLVVCDRPSEALDRFERYPRLLRIEARDERLRAGRLVDGVPVRVHAATPPARAAALQRATGSAGHNEALDRAAARAGLVVDESGVYAIDAGGARGARIAVPSEEALYAEVGLDYVPPELRDGGDEIDRAARRALPRLVTLADVRGMVHCHTTASDGRASVEEMARAAEARGMAYLTVTDHSPTASYAGGLEAPRLRAQWKEIAEVQKRVGVRILRGTESDIRKDGALDYPDSLLRRLDVIVASVHNRYRLDEAAMTARVVRAMRHPLRKIWGHGLGRLLLHRPPIDVDVDAVLDAAAETGAIIELNGDPFRLDLPPLLARRARARGLRFVVSVDAHSTRNYDFLDLGITMARRAGLEARDVLNTWDADAFADAVRPAR